MMHLSCAGRVVADYVVRPELALLLGPRPYLHPIRTLAGVRVSDAVPQDHPWHVGMSVALQHVQDQDGRSANFWGGRTYVADQGYEWLDDHGRIEHVRWIAREPAAFEQELSWRVPGRPPVLRERRRLAARAVSLSSAVQARTAAWALPFRFELENVSPGPVTLGSPGTHGRSGGGYGGFFWRTSASGSDYRLFTGTAVGEDAVHGRSSPWLVFGGSEPGTGRPWSLLLAGEDEVTRDDPWFVRTRDYPGVGSALAYEKPVRLEPGERVARSLLVVLVDGIITADTAAAVLAAGRDQ